MGENSYNSVSIKNNRKSISESETSVSTLVYSDSVIFKLYDKYYFLSDIQYLLHLLFQFSCLPPRETKYLTHFIPSIFQLKQFPELNYNNLTKFKIIFEEVARLIKLFKYLQKQNFFEIKKETINQNLQKEIKASKYNSQVSYPNLCHSIISENLLLSFKDPKNNSLHLDIIKLRQSNQFLENKFQLNSYTITEQEIAIYKQRTKSSKSNEQLKTFLKNIKFNEAYINFINTLNRQIPAEYLWRK